VRTDTMLLIYVAAVLLQHLANRGTLDHLPAAPALAILMGDGVLVLLVLIGGLLSGPSRPAS